MNVFSGVLCNAAHCSVILSANLNWNISRMPQFLLSPFYDSYIHTCHSNPIVLWAKVESNHFITIWIRQMIISSSRTANGPLTRYVKLLVAHALGMPGTFSSPVRVSDPDMHHGTCVTHVPWCMPVSLTSGFLWSRWRGKRSRHSRRMRNPQFYISGKRPMVLTCWNLGKNVYVWEEIQNCFVV